MSQPTEEQVKQSMAHYAKAYGDSPLPSMTLFTLITAQSLRPVRYIPLLVSANLVLSSYMSVAGYKAEAAGQMAAWSGVYWLLAARRKHATLGAAGKLSLRGGLRLATMGLCAANVLGGGWAWMVGKRKKVDEVLE